MSATSYAYTSLDVSHFARPMTLLSETLTPSCSQIDAELSRLIGTLRLNAKVRALCGLISVKDGRDDALKDSESTSRDLSMQLEDPLRGDIIPRPECQFHPNVRIQSLFLSSPQSLTPSSQLDHISLARRTLRMSSPPLYSLPRRNLPNYRRRIPRHNLHPQSIAPCLP